MYPQLSGLSGEDAARIMRPNTAGYMHTAGIVSPMMNAKQWISAQSAGARGMVPTLENHRSSDSTDRSASHKQDDSTVATLATEGSADDLERREATASALLLVSTAAVHHSSKTETPSATQNEDGSDASSGSAPLKKRKKHLDFLRRNSQSETVNEKTEPCHVSPVSHSSNMSSHVEGRTVSREEVTPDRPGRRLTPHSQRSSSYDSKDSPLGKTNTQELMSSSKIRNASDISLPSQVIIPHFPSVLHQVLSDSEYAGTVLAWLPDGEAWKVLRWDALRRDVLPRYFSSLRDENGSGCGTIDAFLYHLTSWGFKEITDGSDIGAYKHDLFIRGAQKLCSKMRSDGAAVLSAPNTVSPARGNGSNDERAMLQVPTLASGPVNALKRELSNGTHGANKRSRFEEQSSSAPTVHTAGIHRHSPGPLGWTGYRAEDPYTEQASWGHYYTDTARMYPAHYYLDARYAPSHPAQQAHVMSQPTVYSPPQVRSGRGAMRVSSGAREASTPSPQNGRPAFPVSTRGKGRKTARGTTPNSQNEKSLTPAPGQGGLTAEEAERIGKSVQIVATAISRKTKRKLPLSRNVSKEENITAEQQK